MTYLECEIPENIGFVIPIGDIHLGDPAFRKESLNKLNGYINWIKENPNSRVFLMGDLFNCATRISKTSPFDNSAEEGEGNNEFEQIVKLFYPIREQIVGAIDGNHEHRIEDFANYNITLEFCKRLGIKYAHISCIVNFKIGKNNRKENTGGQWNEQYRIYFHHGTGGGNTSGGKINRAEKLMDIVEGCDAFVIGHNHGMGNMVRYRYYPSVKSKKIEKRKIHLVCIGGFLGYDDSYAERKMLSPVKLGAVRIRLDGRKHDLHVSD